MTSVLLDTGILAMLTHARQNPRLVEWVQRLLQDGTRLLVPEIADYELRRELVRENLEKSIQRLDRLADALGYLPLTTAIMRRAAEFWAEARNLGRPTADDKALDGDVILAAQASAVASLGHEVVIATTNVGHLSLFADARKWEDIA